MANGLAKARRTDRLKSIGIFLLGVAGIVWIPSMLYLVGTNGELVDKNHRLVEIVDELEARNEELNDRLDCRARRTDAMNEAVGRGLAAVAVDDEEELARQAQVMLDILQRPPCE